MKNYNSDVNSKDIITVDYMITGGREQVKSDLCKKEKKSKKKEIHGRN